MRPMKGVFAAGVIAAAGVMVAACGTPVPPTTTTTTTVAPDDGRYVSAGLGIDAGDCSESIAPCRTINYAVSHALEGETVHVAAGTYDELVVVTKALVFEGANAQRSAGVDPDSRSAESIVKGFRTPGEPHPVASGANSVTVDGFTIDPQGDAALIAAPTHHLVALFGGAQVSVTNNVFNGGDWVSDCGSTCTTMTDAAVMVMSGTYEVTDNSFANFRAPIDVTQFDAAHPVESGTISGNVITHVTNRAIWVNEYLGGPFPGTITVSDNVLDATGWDSPSWSPAGIVMTSGGNTVSGNTFTGFGSGVFHQVCDGTNVASASNSFVDNTFVDNRSGIQVLVAGACGTTTVEATISGNQFDGGLWSGAGVVDAPKIGVRWNGATRPNDLVASCNWWGSADGAGAPGASTVTAGVEAVPVEHQPRRGPATGSEAAVGPSGH